MMNRHRKIVIGIIVLIVFIIGIFTIVRQLHIIPDIKLSGVETKQDFPRISLKTFWTGQWQADIEKWLSVNLGIRAIFIKIDNQINYTFFDVISAKYHDNIILGKNKWLYEQALIDYFNKRNGASLADLEKQVQSLKRLQSILESRGIHFFLLITPTKTSIYPEHIKEKDIIDNPLVKQTNREQILPLLNRYDVHYLDGSQFLMELKKTSPYPLFSRSGLHWNYYSAYFFTVQLISYLENMMNKKMTKIYCKRIIEENDPFKDEADLANLTNIIFTRTLYDHQYYHPETYSLENQKEIFRPKMLFVGGSFLWQIFHYLEKHKVYSERDAYFYYKRYFRYPEHLEYILEPIHKESSNLSRYIFSQNIIIIEANETALNHIGFGFVEDSLKAMEPLNTK